MQMNRETGQDEDARTQSLGVKDGVLSSEGAGDSRSKQFVISVSVLVVNVQDKMLEAHRFLNDFVFLWLGLVHGVFLRSTRRACQDGDSTVDKTS